MDDKMKGYVASFLVGGVFGVLAFLAFTAYQMMGVPIVWSITFMVYTIALLGGLMTLNGSYQKLTRLSGMGAMMPMSGLSAGMAEYIIMLRKQGTPTSKALKMGMEAPLKIFATCYGVALVLSIMAKFTSITLVVPPDPATSVGFAPLIVGFQPMGIVYAFLVSGAWCLIGQLFFVNTKLGFVKIFMGAVAIGAIFSATGIMDHIVNYASAGMIVSVIGAGEAAALGFKALLLNGDSFGIVRYSCLVLAILGTGLGCGALTKETAND